MRTVNLKRVGLILVGILMIIEKKPLKVKFRQPNKSISSSYNEVILSIKLSL